MGQNVSTLQEYTPDTKPPQRENSHSLENPKNENEENELNERESENAMQKKMGVKVLIRRPEMPLKMESFIIDTIIVEKLKHSGKFQFSDMAYAIAEKLEGQYGGPWNVLISKTMTHSDSGYYFCALPGTDIRLRYESFTYTVFKTR